ncbi:SsrA-binding protein SmpB [Candidatus Peregrinibacteria bacterium]|nr:SsrA-binding protein SmpB [Candidatus Peregrinibacteria bacterium]
MKTKLFAKNKKAYFDNEVLDDFEAGLVLNGDEVKAIRLGNANLKGSYISIEKTQAFVKELHISRYKHSARKNYDPVRPRKLILHKKEIEKIDNAISTKGITGLPLELYGKGGLIKLKIGICKGKKLYDKRKELKKRAQDKEIAKALKKYSW